MDIKPLPEKWRKLIQSSGELKEIQYLHEYIVYIHTIKGKIAYIGVTQDKYGIRQYTNRSQSWKDAVQAAGGIFRVEILLHNIHYKPLATSIAKAAKYYFNNRHKDKVSFVDTPYPKTGANKTVEEAMLIAQDVYDFINILYPAAAPTLRKSTLYLDINVNKRNYKFVYAR